jgi:hypothetical protein
MTSAGFQAAGKLHAFTPAANSHRQQTRIESSSSSFAIEAPKQGAA